MSDAARSNACVRFEAYVSRSSIHGLNSKARSADARVNDRRLIEFRDCDTPLLEMHVVRPNISLQVFSADVCPPEKRHQ